MQWDTTGWEHFASYEFTLEYQKGTDNTATDALSRVPINQDRDTVWSLLEGCSHWHSREGEALTSLALWVEHDCLCEEAQAHALRLAPMHMTNWGEAQGEDPLVAACQKWMHTRKDVDP